MLGENKQASKHMKGIWPALRKLREFMEEGDYFKELDMVNDLVKSFRREEKL